MRSLCAVALAGSMVFASCGSDDDAGDTPGDSLSEPSSDVSIDDVVPTEPTTEDTADAVEPEDAEPAEVNPSEDGNNDSTDTAASDADSSSGDTANELAAFVASLYEGTFEPPPTDSPPPATDKSVWVISCGEAAAGCAEVAGGANEAADAMGWETTLYDGRLGADGAYPAGVRQAVAAGADGILIGAVDCLLIAQPLAEARDAGITIVGIGSYDCDDERLGGGEKLFDASTFSADDRPMLRDDSLANGDARAAWLLNETGSSGHEVLVFHHVDSLLGSDYAAGFESRIEAECADCVIVPIDFTFADLATGEIGSKTSDALVKNPNADALFVPYDSLLLLGVAQAVVRSGRADDVTVVGGEGYAPNLELIETDGGQDVAIGTSGRWTGWGGVDTMNRLFAGEEPVAQGFGLRLIDAEHMVETDGVVSIPPIDYKSLYRAAWGVE